MATRDPTFCSFSGRGRAIDESMAVDHIGVRDTLPSGKIGDETGG